MSTLEERREARRRRRAAEEETVGTLSKSEISSLVDERLQQRRLERQRRKEEAASVNGGEDDSERRRRERREARLRTDSAPAEEETSSRRSRRNRGGDDETPAEDSYSSRSRRRRGGDEQDEAPAPSPAEEEKTEEEPAAQEDDSAAREAEEAERRRQEEEEEERRRQQEEMRRQQQEELRRREEQRKEEERLRRTSMETQQDSRRVQIPVSSPPASGLPSVTSPTEYTAFPFPASTRSVYSGLPNTGRSALSECVYNYASDDAISDLASENQRLLEMSSDCDLGSSFDDYAFSEHDNTVSKLRGPALQKMSQPRTRGISPLAIPPLELATSPLAIPPLDMDMSPMPAPPMESFQPADCEPHGSPDLPPASVPRSRDQSFASSQDEDEHFVPLSREHQGTMVEGDQASQDLHRYRSRRRGQHTQNSCDESSESETTRPHKLRKSDNASPSDVSSDFSRQNSEGFEYAAHAAETATTDDREFNKQDSKEVTPRATMSPASEVPVPDRDDCPYSNLEQMPPASFTSKAGNTPTSIHNRPVHSPVHAKLFKPGKRRSLSSTVDVAKPGFSGHQRSVTPPSHASAGRHHDITSRMSELQRQLQGRTSDSGHFPIHRLRSQGDFKMSHSQARAQITDLIGQLSNRLKKRDVGLGESTSTNNEESYSVYKRHSEPLLTSLPKEVVAPSTRMTSLRDDRITPQDDSLLEEDEDSFMEASDASDCQSADQEPDPKNSAPQLHDSSQHAASPVGNLPLHATPPTPALTRPTSGLPPSRGGRPDKIKEELRLCLDFLDDPAEGFESDEDEAQEFQQQNPMQARPSDYQDIDTSSCSSPYDASPSVEYTETDDFAEDEASYAQGISAYFSEDSFSQTHVPDFHSAWDRDRAASMPDISVKGNSLFQSVMIRSVSPPKQPHSHMVTPSPPVTSPATPSVIPADLPSPPVCAAHQFPVSPSPPPLMPPQAPLHRPLRSSQPDSLSFPPPPPPLDSVVMNSSVSVRAAEKRSDGHPTHPAASSATHDNHVDLHSMLCQEIVQIGQVRSGHQIAASLSSSDHTSSYKTKSDSVEHLIRPSALKSGLNLRDWSSSPFVTNSSLKNRHNSESSTASYDSQEVSLKKSARSELTAAPRRKTLAGDTPGGYSLLSFWQKKEAGTNKDDLSPPWKQSPTSVSKKNKPAAEIKTTLTVTEKKDTLFSKWQSMSPKKVDSISEVKQTVVSKPRHEHSSSMTIILKPNIQTEPPDVSNGGSSAADEFKKRKIPPPTLPKSSATKSLQFARSFLQEKTTTLMYPHNTSRMSSTSSLDSEVFITSYPSPNVDGQNLSRHDAESKYLSTDSARESDREHVPAAANRVDNVTGHDSGFVSSKTLSQNVFHLRRESQESSQFQMSKLFERRQSNKLNGLQDNLEPQHDEGSNVSVKKTASEVSLTESQSGSETEASRKRAVPKPRFNARRLTQEMPKVWKCSEELKTEYKPAPINDSADGMRTFELHHQTDLGPEPHKSSLQNVSDKHKSEYKSWAADYLKDRIMTSENSGNNSARSTQFYTEKSYLNELSDTRHASTKHNFKQAPPSVKPKPMSISERINLLNKAQSPKTSTSSISDIKPGSISDREGPDDIPHSKARQPGPTIEQKQFATLLQSRLINIIADEDAESKRTKSKEKARKTSPHKKITPAEEIARSRAWASGSKKPLKMELPTWSPELTSTPAPLSRTATDFQLLNRQNSGSVMDMAKEFDHLSDSISKEEDEKRLSSRRKRGCRRLSTGMSVKEMKDMFDNHESMPSSATSTRNNSPKPLPLISERKLERFDAPTIAENRPVVEKNMVPLSLTGAPRSSVLDIVKKVETGRQDIKVPAPRRPSENYPAVDTNTAATPSVSLLRVGAVITDDAGAPVRKGKMDKSRRYTTGVNFAELQLRFSQPDSFKKTNQSRAMSTIYASSQDITRQYDSSACTSTSTRSMENLITRESAVGIFRTAKSRMEKSTDALLDLSKDSAFEKSLSRAESAGGALDCSHVTPPDIQSLNGSAFSRISTIHSPIKLSDPSVSSSATSLNRSPVEACSLSATNSARLTEEEARLEAERAEQERKQQEEEERRREEEEKKKKKKRKGLGGLSPEKKKLLKKLIMQKAAEDLRNEALAKAEEKQKYINERVTPLKADGLGQAELQQLVKELHSKVAVLEEEVYDWEIKIRKQDFEINELTLKVNDTKGKFIKPVLRKVNKTESKLTKLLTKGSRDFRGNLKSTGQNKFALKDDDDTSKQPDWRDTLKHGEGEEAPAES